jgi:hypothetical protein
MQREDADVSSLYTRMSTADTAPRLPTRYMHMAHHQALNTRNIAIALKLIRVSRRKKENKPSELNAHLDGV